MFLWPLFNYTLKISSQQNEFSLNIQLVRHPSMACYAYASHLFAYEYQTLKTTCNSSKTLPNV